MRFSSWSWNTGPALYSPQGAWRVYGSLPNQSTCALWIWRRHSTVSLVVFCGECSMLREYGVRGPLGHVLLRAVRSLYDRSLAQEQVQHIVSGSKSVQRSQGPGGSPVWETTGFHLCFLQMMLILSCGMASLQARTFSMCTAGAWSGLQPECEAAGMRISTSKSEAMVLDRKRVVCALSGWVEVEVLPQVEEFKYLGVLSRV
ncbi:hypothetical protein L3Q82_009232 [Scortum barcoo]|uniref:Uncharacterized protein n=1 Tax=Scortum barcoo TaxID=214431 RepID=A0ACB8WH80_9TELE|nr:hypothetical protein L3Q82_009232 [Scortum barcoo]